MRYYMFNAGQDPECYSGEFSPPYPDLFEIYLGQSTARRLHVTIQGGNEPGDMIFGASNVVSQRVLDVLDRCRATGYEPIPVEVSGGDVGFDYWGLKLLGRGGAFDEKRSEARYTPGGGTWIGFNYIYMDEDKWDGSDVFAIPGLGINAFVTERIKAALEKAKLRNVCLVLNTDCYLGGPRLRAYILKRREELRRSDAH